MISVNYKKKLLFKMSSIWFATTKVKTPGIISYYHQIPEIFPEIKNHSFVLNMQLSLLIDLSETKEEIFSKFNKVTKYEIRKIASDNFKIECFTSNEIKDNKKIMKEFENDYIKYIAKAKGIKGFNKKHMMELVKNNAFFLMKISCEDNFVWQSFVADEFKVRSLNIVSNFRKEGISRKNSGMLNRYLYWHAILYFKHKGKIELDMGGISSIEDPNGVDRFKIGFGGKPSESYNVLYANTFIGKIFINFLKKINK